MEVSPTDDTPAERENPWTFVTRKHRVSDDVAPARKPVPSPAKSMAPRGAKRRAKQRADRQERWRQNQAAIERFKKAQGITKCPPKRQASSVAQDLRRNPPESVSELLDRYWKPEHYVAQRSKRRAD